MDMFIDLKIFGGPTILAKKAGISRMTLWRALHKRCCSVITARRIQEATGGKISAVWLLRLSDAA
jgi:DNA-binding phage protein